MVGVADHSIEVPEGGVEEWWILQAAGDVKASLPKIEEYGGERGSTDLWIMGSALAELLDMHGVDDAVKLEMACWFYSLGKVSRLVSDYKRGERGKPDTWFDLSVYAMMARRIQQSGNWP